MKNGLESLEIKVNLKERINQEESKLLEEADIYEDAGSFDLMREALGRLALLREIQKQLDLVDSYQELLYAVETKVDGETRHETALKYIKQAERGVNLTEQGGL